MVRMQDGGLRFNVWYIQRASNGVGYDCFCGGYWCDSYLHFENAYRWFYCRAVEYGFKGRMPKGWRDSKEYEKMNDTSIEIKEVA